MSAPEPAPFTARLSAEPPRDPDIVQFAEYAAILRAAAASIIIAVVAGAIAGGLYAMTRPTRYASAAMMVIEEPREGQKATPLSDAITVREVLDSDNLQRELAKRLEAAGSTAENVDLNLDAIPGTRLVRIRATAPDAARAARAAESAAGLLIETEQRISQSQATATLDQLAAQLGASRKNLAEREAALRAEAATGGIQSLHQYDLTALPNGETRASNRPPAQSQPDQTRQLMDLMVELEGEQARLAAAEAQLGRLPRDAAPEPQPGDADALVRRSQARAGAPDIAALPSSGSAVRTALQYEAAASRNRIAQLQRERDALAKLLNISGSDVERLKQLYARRLAFSKLEGEFSVADRLTTELSSRYEQARADVNSRRSGLVLIDHAAAPRGPESKRVGLTAAFAALVAGALTSALVLARGRAAARA